MKVKGEKNTIRPVWGKDYSLRPSRLDVMARRMLRVLGCKFGGGGVIKNGRFALSGDKK